MNLFEKLLYQGQSDHAIAIQCDDETLTYNDLRRRVQKARGWIRSVGLVRGDTLALQTKKTPRFVEILLACFAEGVVALPLNPLYTSRELEYYLTDSNSKLAITTMPVARSPQACKTVGADDLETLLRHAQASSNLAPDSSCGSDRAMLMYTSGTTGKPKGACLSHSNILATVSALHDAWEWRPSDKLLHALPLFHVHGLFVAQFTALFAGASAIWLDRFDPREAAYAISANKCTLFMGVPTFYSRLLKCADDCWDFSSVRLFTSGSAPLAARTHEQFEHRFGHAILERYGMTEIGIVLSNPVHGERRPGSVGLPLPGIEARIADRSTNTRLPPGTVGELQILGASVFSEYLNRPDASKSTKFGAWMKTGDLGYQHDDGYFTLVGRSSDMLISGGLNVYPAEVTNILCEHPDIVEAAVFGVDDDDLGERVVAVIVATGELVGFKDWLQHQLVGYKRPKEIRFTSKLPRNAMGKIDRGEIRDSWHSYSTTPQ